ncbi:MAG: hypothetical protein HGA53_05305 [Anaerolineaceae bacterium]|nr:hypothetical protein [Anaerolineaceae bacterium]
MNDQKLDKKVSQDAARVKKDVSTLVGDSTAQLSRFEDKLSQSADKARADITSWVEDGVSQISTDIEKFTGDAKDTLAGAATSVTKDVGHRLRQYNAKAQEIANKAPGSIGKKAARYPWVAITIGLVFGILLGVLFKPAHQSHTHYQI